MEYKMHVKLKYTNYIEPMIQNSIPKVHAEGTYTHNQKDRDNQVH